MLGRERDTKTFFLLDLSKHWLEDAAAATTAATATTTAATTAATATATLAAAAAMSEME